MLAYKGRVENGRIVLPEGADLPEGAIVTVTIGEAEFLRAKLRWALRRRTLKPARVRLGELGADLSPALNPALSSRTAGLKSGAG